MVFFKIFKKTRTLKVNILTLFLTLLSVSFLCVISFTYTRNYKAIDALAKNAAEERIAIVLERFNAMALTSERVVSRSSVFLPLITPFSFENKVFINYLLNFVKYDPHFTSYYVGLEDGTFIGAVNNSYWVERTFVSEPSKLLPKDAKFTVRVLDRTQNPPVNNWHYLNDDYQQVAFESTPGEYSDPRVRPWYVGAEKVCGLYWTGFYTFRPGLGKGISVANPIMNSDGKMIGVVGADLTFELLSEFLNAQKIGKTGRVFILDEAGKIVVPPLTTAVEASSHITLGMVDDVYQKFTNNPGRPDYLVKSKGVEYICYITKLPVIFGSKWMMLSIAPVDDFFGPLIIIQKQVLVIILGILIISGLIVVYFAKRISSPIVILAEEVNKIGHLEMKSDVRVVSNIKEIVLIDNAIAAMRRVISSFVKYVPKEIIKDLFLKNEEIALGGQKRELTIFFSDIEGFTPIAESNSIDVLTPLLTEYFDAMSKIILSSHGTIDKFLGDGIMAFWGAPLEFPDHTARACTAALRCNAMLSKLNQERRKNKQPEFLTRFGINTGTVIVGNIGTEDRMNYTIIGDAVNTTSRLQEVDKVYHTSIIISEDAYKKLGTEFIARPLDVVSVKGKKEKIKIYELKGKTGGEEEIAPGMEQIALCKEFTEAYEAMQNKDFQKALSLFTGIAEKFPNDYPTQIYLQRLKETGP